MTLTVDEQRWLLAKCCVSFVVIDITTTNSSDEIYTLKSHQPMFVASASIAIIQGIFFPDSQSQSIDIVLRFLQGRLLPTVVQRYCIDSSQNISTMFWCSIMLWVLFMPRWITSVTFFWKIATKSAWIVDWLECEFFKCIFCITQLDCWQYLFCFWSFN